MHSRIVQESFSYPVYSIILLVFLLEQDGIQTTEILKKCGLARDSLFCESTRTSFRQIHGFISLVLKDLKDSTFTFRAGLFVKRENCSFFGYGLMCSASHKDADDFGIKYEMTIGSLGKTHFIESDDVITFIYEPVFFIDINDPAYQFIMELQTAMAYSIKKDIFGLEFNLCKATFRYDKPANYAVYDDIYSCPVTFGEPYNSISYSTKWRDSNLETSNSKAMPFIVELCDKKLMEIHIENQVEEKVRRILMRDPSNFPCFEELATELAMHPRTLRRLLKLAGTSYRDILSEIQKNIALKYLSEGRMTHDEIAQSLGFCDGASFRKAYLRWTK